MSVPGSLYQNTIRKTRGLHWHNNKSDQIEQSMWLDGSSQDLSRSGFTLSSDGQKELIVSMWVKRLEMGRAQEVWILGNASGITSYNDIIHANFNADDTLTFQVVTGGSDGGQVKPNALFRDIGWYHLLFSFNSNTSVVDNKDRLRLYVNGERQTDLATNTAVADNRDVRGSLTGSADFRFGRNTHPSLNYFHKAYMAQACYLEGVSIQAGDYAVSDFLDTWPFGDNGTQFVPKKTSDITALASAVGGNSFCLDFADTGTFGNDVSSNNNNLSDAGSPTAANQSRNSPSLQYPIINPLTKVGSAASTLSEGNTKATVNDNGGIVISDPLPSTGLWYFEIDATTVAQFYPGIGQQSALGYNSTGAWNNGTADTHVWMVDDASGRFNNNGSLSTYVGSASSTGRYAVAWDGDNRALYFGSISGSTITWVFSGDPTSGASKTGAAPGTWPTTGTDPLYFIVIGGGTSVMKFYFEEDDWTGVTNRPAAAVELNTKNFAGPDYQGIDYFDATLYEGNGTGQRVGDFVPFTDLYNVANSIIFDVTTKNHLQRTMSAAASDSNKQFTLNAWVKRVNPNQTFSLVLLESADGSGANAAGIRIASGSGGGAFHLYAQGGGVTGSGVSVYATQKSGQTSSWQHFLCQVDTTQATASDRVKLYVDGVLMAVDNGGGGAAAYPDQDAVFYLGDNDFATQIGKIPYGAFYNSMYLSEHAFVTGTNSTSKTISDYGSLDTATNRWIPKDISGFTFGHNGHYLEFQTTPGSGNGAGTDTSGNSNHFAEAINGSAAAWTSYTDYQFIDTPSKNYATLDPGRAGSGVVLSEGNLNTDGTDDIVLSTMPIPESGKWAFTANIDVLDFSFGIVSEQNSLTTKIGRTATSWGIIESTGASLFRVEHNSVGSFNLGSQPSVNNKLIAAIDTDTNSLWLGYDTGSGFTYFGGGNPATGATPTYQGVLVSGQRLHFAVGRDLSVSFGGQSASLYGTLPTGFLELNQDNLDATASKLTALAWIKNRDATDSHILVDRVRGVGEVLHSDAAATEATEPNTVQRFLQRGVQVGSDVQVNTANESYVLWQWLVGDSATTGSTTAPAGTIASTSIAADAGHFSVGTYTGQTAAGTVGHGLGGVAEMVIVWDKGADNSIAVYHVGAASDAETDYLLLNQTDGATDNATFWNDTAPTSSVFSVGTGNNTNGNGRSKSFLAFRSVAGVCKVGSYTGNGNADGPYVSLGFKPRWIMYKLVGTESWEMYDTVRQVGNVYGTNLKANLSNAETDDTRLDILSDGFKARSSNSGVNTSGSTYIYLAMAEIGGNAAYPPIYGG